MSRLVDDHEYLWVIGGLSACGWSSGPIARLTISSAASSHCTAGRSGAAADRATARLYRGRSSTPAVSSGHKAEPRPAAGTDNCKKREAAARIATWAFAASTVPARKAPDSNRYLHFNRYFIPRHLRLRPLSLPRCGPEQRPLCRMFRRR